MPSAVISSVQTHGEGTGRCVVRSLRFGGQSGTRPDFVQARYQPVDPYELDVRVVTERHEHGIAQAPAPVVSVDFLSPCICLRMKSTARY